MLFKNLPKTHDKHLSRILGKIFEMKATVSTHKNHNLLQHNRNINISHEYLI